MRWTDGSPIASGSSNEGASVSGGTRQGLPFVVPADTTTRTLVVYVGTANSTGKLTATLSDRSAPDYANVGDYPDHQELGRLLHADLSRRLGRANAHRAVDGGQGQEPEQLGDRPACKARR